MWYLDTILVYLKVCLRLTVFLQYVMMVDWVDEGVSDNSHCVAGDDSGFVAYHKNNTYTYRYDHNHHESTTNTKTKDNYDVMLFFIWFYSTIIIMVDLRNILKCKGILLSTDHTQK